MRAKWRGGATAVVLVTLTAAAASAATTVRVLPKPDSPTARFVRQATHLEHKFAAADAEGDDTAPGPGELVPEFLPFAPSDRKATPQSAPVAPTPMPPDAEPTALDLSDDEAGMTLAELQAIALANNPTLVQAAMRIRAAQGDCVQAGLYPNPTVGYIGDEMGLEGSAGQQGMFLGQEFVTGGKRKLDKCVAGHAIIQAQHAWQAQRLRVVNDVSAAFYEALVAQRSVELHEELVRIGRQGEKTAGDLLRLMEVSRVDLLQAQIEAETAELKLVDARHRCQAVWRRLAAIVGLPDLPPSNLVGDLKAGTTERSWDETLCRLLDCSPELAEAYAGIQRAECEVARQCAQKIPNVDVNLGLRYDDAAHDTVTTVEVGVALPIFNRNQGNVCRAQAHLAAAHKEVERRRLVLQSRLAEVFERYADARNQAQKYRDEIRPNAQRSLDLVGTGYRQGEFDYLTLLTAQRTYFRVNLAYLESLRTLLAADVALEGFLLSGALTEPAAATAPAD